jgi:VCBS repeat-containing protein
LADTTPTSGGTATSFSNTPQAQTDSFTFAITGLTEDTGTVYLSVLANDLGGAAKTLYSVDDGIGAGSASYSDLLQKDVAAISSDTSAMGARIWVNADGTVGYSTTGVDRFQQLSAGEIAEDCFVYAIRLGNGTLSWARVCVQVMGTNDQPQILAANSKATGLTAELVNQRASTTNNAVSGAIAFKDVDLSDTHTAHQADPIFSWSGGTLSDSQTAAL